MNKWLEKRKEKEDVIQVSKAIELAAGIWCDPRTSHIEMDVRLAEVIAEKFEELLKYAES